MRLAEALGRILGAGESPNELDVADLQEELEPLYTMTCAYPAGYGYYIVLTRSSTIHDICGYRDGIKLVFEVGRNRHEYYKGLIDTHLPDKGGYQGVA